MRWMGSQPPNGGQNALNEVYKNTMITFPFHFARDHTCSLIKPIQELGSEVGKDKRAA